MRTNITRLAKNVGTKQQLQALQLVMSEQKKVLLNSDNKACRI